MNTAAPASDRERAIVEGLLDAYRVGMFPMGEPDSDEVGFYQPDPRGVLPLPPPAKGPWIGLIGDHPAFHCPRSVSKLLRRGRFHLRCDTAFEAVVEGCAKARRRGTDDQAGIADSGTWINRTIAAWYNSLHRAGHAHSIEAWVSAHNDDGQRESRLVGGIYGVAIGSAFFGESMFHETGRPRADGSRDPFDGTSAGQVCLVALVTHLSACGFQLFDTQMVTGVTRRFGAFEVPHTIYMRGLQPAVADTPRWKHPEWAENRRPA